MTTTTTTTMRSETARVSGWGKAPFARRVTHLTPEERAHVRAGGLVLVRGPDGAWSRRVVVAGQSMVTRTYNEEG